MSCPSEGRDYIITLRMGNETKEPGTPGAAGEEAVPQRNHVHLVLGLILIPYLSAALGWTLAILDVLRGYASKTQLAWTRVLVALVLVDSLFVMGLVWKGSDPEEFKRMAESLSAPRSQIGIVFDPEDAGAPPLIARTRPGLPAETAGFQSGDLILEVDGSPVKTQGEAVEVLIRGTPGVARKIKVRRAGESRDLDVVPAPYPKFELFQILREAPARDWLAGLQGMIPALLFGLLAWVVARWRFGDSGKFWLAILILFVLTEGVSYAAGRLVQSAMGGMSVGGFLYTTGVDTLTLLGLSLVLRRLLPDPRLASLDAAPRPIWGVYFRAVFYLIAGAIRIGFLLMLLDLLAFGGKGGGNPMQLLIENTNLGTLGTILLVVEVVILAPIGEELLFRGFLLPRLQLQKGPVWAVAVSSGFFALLHPQYGVYVPIVLLYGAVLGWARLRSGGLTAPILLHATINGVSVLAMLMR